MAHSKGDDDADDDDIGDIHDVDGAHVDDDDGATTGITKTYGTS